MKISELQEAIKGWKHAHSDISKMRADRAAQSHQARLVSLKKDGTESKMHDASSTYPTEADARRRHADLVKMNPGRNIRHNLYVDNKLVGVLDKDNLLEFASSGATSAGSVASVANPSSMVMRRPNLFGYVPPTPKRKTSKSKSK